MAACQALIGLNQHEWLEQTFLAECPATAAQRRQTTRPCDNQYKGRMKMDPAPGSYDLRLNTKWWFHLAVLLLGICLALPYLSQESHYGILDFAILPFHEAGHYILMPFAPEFLVVAVGSVVQIGLPLAFAIYFWWKIPNDQGTLHCHDSFAAGVALFWTASLLQGMAGLYERLPLPSHSDPGR